MVKPEIRFTRLVPLQPRQARSVSLDQLYTRMVFRALQSSHRYSCMGIGQTSLPGN